MNNDQDPATDRLQIASRIHDLLRRETGQEVDVNLMLGPPEYAKAVLSLCRACGHPELARLAEQFSVTALHRPVFTQAAGASSPVRTPCATGWSTRPAP